MVATWTLVELSEKPWQKINIWHFSSSASVWEIGSTSLKGLKLKALKSKEAALNFHSGPQVPQVFLEYEAIEELVFHI